MPYGHVYSSIKLCVCVGGVRADHVIAVILTGYCALKTLNPHRILCTYDTYKLYFFTTKAYTAAGQHYISLT